MKKQGMIQIKSRKPYWSVLTPDPIFMAIFISNTFKSLLPTHYQNTEGIPVSAPERVPGKEKTEHPK